MRRVDDRKELYLTLGGLVSDKYRSNNESQEVSRGHSRWKHRRTEQNSVYEFYYCTSASQNNLWLLKEV